MLGEERRKRYPCHLSQRITPEEERPVLLFPVRASAKQRHLKRREGRGETTRLRKQGRAAASKEAPELGETNARK